MMYYFRVRKNISTLEKPRTRDASEKKQIPSTPYYLLDESILEKNLKKIARLKEASGAKVVLALKCFSTWSVFDMMKPYLDGTTSSSLYEAKLVYEKFGKETHAYSVAYSDADIKEVRTFASKIIFNSGSQLKRFLPLVKGSELGLRINPGVSHSHFDLANPARCHSRLGVTDKKEVEELLPHITGAMFHFNCENDDLASLSALIDTIADNYAAILKKLKWVSFGGGIYFTKEGYPLDEFAKKLRAFAKQFDVQIYLEPGESVITNAGSLVTTVLDVVHNGIDVAIVDAAVETHMLDLLIYQTPAKVDGARPAESSDGVSVMVAGRTCLAGDVFGTYKFSKPLQIGDRVTFLDAAGYTMVKKNWFNGVQMPSIVVKRLDGRVDVARVFDYDDYVSSLS